MKNWVTKTIKDVVIDLHQGLNTAGYKIKFYDSGYPIIQTRNLENGVIDLDEKMKFMSKTDWLIYKDKYKPNIGDVFLTNIGTIGKTAVVTEEQDYLIHWNIFIFKVDKKIIDPFYLKTFLDSPFCFEYYLSCQKGGTVNFITKKMIEVLEIPLPPLPEQQRIVSILDEAFAAIAKAKANAEQNLKNAKELFESYLQGVFENKGEGWEEKMLKEIGIAQTGTTPKTADKENYGDFIPFIKPADIDIKGNGEIRYDNDGLSEQGLKNGRKMLKGSVLMVCIGATIGKVGFVDRDVSCNQQINSLTVNNDFSSKFIYYALSSKVFFEQVMLNSAQATLPIINKGKWETLTVSFPKSKTEQEDFANKFDLLQIETKKLEAIYQKKINDLEELKKSVLQKAFLGQLKMEN